MKSSMGGKRMRSAKAPQMSAGVMMANMSSYVMKSGSGMCGAIECPAAASREERAGGGNNKGIRHGARSNRGTGPSTLND